MTLSQIQLRCSLTGVSTLMATEWCTCLNIWVQAPPKCNQIVLSVIWNKESALKYQRIGSPTPSDQTREIFCWRT